MPFLLFENVVCVLLCDVVHPQAQATRPCATASPFDRLWQLAFSRRRPAAAASFLCASAKNLVAAASVVAAVASCSCSRASTIFFCCFFVVSLTVAIRASSFFAVVGCNVDLFPRLISASARVRARVGVLNIRVFPETILHD